MTTETLLLIIINADGTRTSREYARQGKDLGWVRKGLHAIGAELAHDRAKWVASVLIIGTEVHQYNANEAREILGLE